MSKPIIARITATGFALTLLSTATAFAGEAAAVHGAKTTGALTLETQGRATDAAAVHRQGGHAVPGAVLWTMSPGDDGHVKQAAAF